MRVVVSEAPELQVAVVEAVVPPRQSIAPASIWSVPFVPPGPVILAPLALNTPAWTYNWAPATLLIVGAKAPILITVAAELIVNLWKVVAADRSVGVPEALVTITVEVPWVKVPPLEKRVPDVPVKVIIEALAVNTDPKPLVEIVIAVKL